MDKEYYCPKCHGYVKVGDFIILVAKNKSKTSGLLLLHPEVGNYSSIKHRHFEIDDKEVLEIHCPLCHVNLASDFDDNLSHLILVEDNKTFDIYFSRIVGEQSTYLVDGQTVTASGIHSDRYTYFKMSDKFKQYLKK
ncbi:MAG: hypothetical protein JXP36_09885 [Bacteroidales bacterium]|nr:hypothetical protein [Bacteroidales bacterium]MBN2819270.1 hypothetical protein [Bacteroidales bacterium]